MKEEEGAKIPTAKRVQIQVQFLGLGSLAKPGGGEAQVLGCRGGSADPCLCLALQATP